MNTTLRLAICLVALVLEGCVFPNRLAEEDPFREDVIAFLNPGTTTKTGVNAQLGDRYLESPDGRWWVFPAYRRMTEWFWIYCTPGACDGAIFGGDVHEYYLIVEFGNDDIVSDFVIVTEKTPCTKGQSICFNKGELTVKVSAVPTTHDLASPHTSRTALLESEVELRDGKFYEIGSPRPYTGDVAMLDHLGFSQWLRTYKDGELTGPETFWYANGQISYQAHYSKNQKHGPETFWNSDGSISAQTCYRNGIMVDAPMDKCPP